MARTSNFSVPLWTRNHFREQAEKPLQETTKDAETRAASLLCRRHKAGRLLGPTDTASGSGPHGNNSYPSSIRQIQKNLTSKRNTLLLEINCNPIEDCTSEPNGWCTRASSPLLGCWDDDYNSMRSKISSHAQPPRSTSTLDSYYDRLSSPPSIPQRTSASSWPYMALEKGCPPIESPPCDGIAGSGKSSKDKAVDLLGKNRKGEKHRPPHLDLSTLFPKLQISSGPPCSPHRVMSSSSVVSLTSGSIHSASSSRPTWLRWRGSKSKGSSSYTNITSPQSSIVPVRTPTISDSCLEPRDMYDWLRDAKCWGLSEYEDVSEYPKEPLEGGTRSPYVSRSASCPLSASIRTLTSQMRDELTSGHDTRFDCKASSYTDSRSCARQTRRSHRSVRRPVQIGHADLHTQSFLALSSSGDESDGHLRSFKESHHPSPKLTGDSCLSDVIRAGSKTFIPPKQSRDVSKHILARSSSLSHKAIKRAPEERSNPSHVPHSSRQGQSVRSQRNLLEDGSTFNNSRRWAGSPIAAKSTKKPFMHRPTELQLRTDRFMAVTRDEEKLLEAMREKRASMRQANFAEDHNDVIEQKEIGYPPRRPKTANAEKCSSLFSKANISSFPTPPSRKSIKVPHHSSDAISHEELP